jgi:hypothetical protein
VLRNQRIITGEKEKSDANDDCDQLHDSSGENFLRQPDTVLATAFWKTRSEGICFPVPEPS